jgi:mono/diheme cytochrome c family protein
MRGEVVMRHLGPVLVALLFGAAVQAVAGTPPEQAPTSPPPGPARAGGAQGADPGLGGVAGAYAFRTHCASCHGADGKGEGPMAENLRFQPADLTLIARKNGGSFPTERVFRIVDGRNPLKGHGGPDMPIWGDAFKNAETGYDDVQVKAKVRSVVDYLKTLQVH